MANIEPEPNQPESTRPTPPWWTWLFVAACVAIPAIALGGAIPGAIGGGGAAACYSVAKNPAISAATRVCGCIGITALCWILFLTLVLLLFR